MHLFQFSEVSNRSCLFHCKGDLNDWKNI